jgi:hypothetical protein
MAHISRPFQVALAAVAVLALVWVVALHRPSSGSSEAKSASQAPVAAAATPKTAATGGSPSANGATGGTGAGVYHGSAPGVEGLTRALAKARGAVAISQQNAKQLQEKSEQASSSAAANTTATPSTARAVAPAKPATKSAPATTQHAAKVAPHHTSLPVLTNQHRVEAELKQGKTVVLLFWSSKGSDDVAVSQALSQLKKSDHRLAVHMTTPEHVASFGSITRGVQVYGTPTLLIVAKHGRTVVLTGLQDAYAIRQAVSEARHA